MGRESHELSCHQGVVGSLHVNVSPGFHVEGIGGDLDRLVEDGDRYVVRARTLADQLRHEPGEHLAYLMSLFPYL